MKMTKLTKFLQESGSLPKIGISNCTRKYGLKTFKRIFGRKKNFEHSMKTEHQFPDVFNLNVYFNDFILRINLQIKTTIGKTYLEQLFTSTAGSLF